MKRSTTHLLLAGSLAGLLSSNLACSDNAKNIDVMTPDGATDGGGGRADGGGAGGRAGSDAAVIHQLNDTFTAANSLAGYAFSDYADTMTRNLTGNYAVDGGASDAVVDGGSSDGDGADALADGGADAAAAPDAAAPGGGPPRPALEWVGSDGNPEAGALKVTVTYTDYRQYVDISRQISPALNLANRVLKAQVKLVSSTPADFPGGIQFHASSGASFDYFGTAGLAFGPLGAWNPILLDLGASGAPFAGNNVVQVGIQFYSGDPPAGMTTLAAPITVVFEIDTITD
jgi:hypothetical protein